MRKLVGLLIALSHSIIISYSQEINFDWNEVVGNTGKTSGLAIQCDSLGNIYASGTFHGSIEYKETAFHSIGANDGFLFKLDPSGTLIWSKQFSSNNAVKVNSLAIDRNNNIIVLGHYRVSVKFDTVVMITNNTDTLISSNMFISKFDPNGNLLWAKSTGGTAYDGNSICIDLNNDIVITGRSINVVFFDTLSQITTIDSFFVPYPSPVWVPYHPETAFIAKYDQYGNKLWIKVMGGYPKDVISDNIGNIIVTGYFSHSHTLFDTTLVPPIGTETAFLVQYSSSGSLNWIRTSGGSANSNSGHGLAVDSENNIYQSGKVFGNNVQFGGNIIIPFAGIDAFLTKYDLHGNLIWNHLIGSPTTMNGHRNANCGIAVKIDNNEDIYLIGYFYDTLTFETTTLRSNGAYDLLLVKYSSDGTVLSAGQYSDYGWISGNDLSIGNDNNLYLTGLTTKNYWSSQYPAYGFIGRVNNSIPTALPSDVIKNSQSNVHVYPNPSNGVIHIEFTDLKNPKRVEIFSSDGKRIRELTCTNSNISVEIKNEGIYFIVIQIGYKVITRQVVVL